MPTDYITIPRDQYEGIIRDIQRGMQVCEDTSERVLNLRLALAAIERLIPHSAEGLRKNLERALECCSAVSRINIELAALERTLREHDQEITARIGRPGSRQDMMAVPDPKKKL